MTIKAGNTGADTAFTFTPIGHIASPFREKFGIPRQAVLTPEAECTLSFAETLDPTCLDGIEQFSHLWLLYCFHAHAQSNWQPRVRPPRLGGNKSIGVFASRSPFRPNALGMSAVRLVAILQRPLRLRLAGCDLLDGTPVFDVKPYLSYADAFPEAECGYAAEAPPALRVHLAQSAMQQLQRLDEGDAIAKLIRAYLVQDPRPTYQDDPARLYKVNLGGYDVAFRVTTDAILVEAITRID